MTGLIARRELTGLMRDGRLPWAGGLVLLLSALALLTGWQHRQSIEAERVAAQSLDYDDWISQAARHPHDAAHQGMHVFKPQPPLGIVDPGIDRYVGSSIWLQAHRQSETRFRPAQDATGLQRFGSFSVAWVLQVLGPLLVIVLGFDAIAGERELGTLRQILSLGVAPRGVLGGKALALAACIAIALVPLFGAVVAAVWIGAPAGWRGDALLRLAGWLAGYAVYFATTIFLVLTVSAAARSSRNALIVLLGLWVVGTMLVPRAAADLARLVYPSPTRLQFDAALDGELSRTKADTWMRTFGVTTPWSPSVPLDRWGYALEVDDKAGYAVMDRHFGQLWDSFEHQQRVQEWPGLLVPLLALRGYSMGLAGTDFSHHRAFSTAAERQRRVMQDVISHDLVEHADPLGDRHFSYRADPDLWRQVPPFAHSPPSAWQALYQNSRSLLVLTLGGVIFLAGALWAMRRPLAR